MQSILIIEDDIPLSISIHQSLYQPIFKIFQAKSLREAYLTLGQRKFDLVIIDRNLPDGDGLEIVQFLTLAKSDTCSLMLTNKNTPNDRVEGLETGADDYLGKPFSLAELRLRVGKLLTKTKHSPHEYEHIGELILYPDKGVIHFRKKEIFLRKKEFQILLFLIRHRNRVISRKMIIDNLWLNENVPTESTIDVYIRRVRTLLGPELSSLIKTIRGYGYIVSEVPKIDDSTHPK